MASRYHLHDYNDKNKSRFSAEEEEEENVKKSDRWEADDTLNSFTDFFSSFALLIHFGILITLTVLLVLVAEVVGSLLHSLLYSSSILFFS
jgi:hypothetical protein